MTPFSTLSERLDAASVTDVPMQGATDLLTVSEAVLENWAQSRGLEPTDDEREGFRLLALHRQGSRGEPSFNACRETCREVAYHYNLINLEPDHPDTTKRLRMMGMVANHLLLFVSGKMRVKKLGEFCCASRSLRSETDAELKEIQEPHHA
ncbi:MAG: hypothetical protein ACR2PF_09045 [Rhizobiaceae bacterium]